MIIEYILRSLFGYVHVYLNYFSSHYGNEKIAGVLLQRGADVNYSAKVRYW